jgi:peptide-methionine (S)-S-oxide reductase
MPRLFPALQSMTAAVFLALAALTTPIKAQALETAIVAGGCFWCVESDFRRVQGVTDVSVGFTGGTERNPEYNDVARGRTAHIESARITFDPAVVSYAQIIHLFFRSIDPLDAGGQFCDRGAQYSTAIFVNGPAQRAAAESAATTASSALGSPVVTQIRNASAFYEAEDYHQDYAHSTDTVLTRFGPRRKAEAYQLYRDGCGRDDRVRSLWGNSAPFVSH